MGIPFVYAPCVYWKLRRIRTLHRKQFQINKYQSIRISQDCPRSILDFCRWPFSQNNILEAYCQRLLSTRCNSIGQTFFHGSKTCLYSTDDVLSVLKPTCSNIMMVGLLGTTRGSLIRVHLSLSSKLPVLGDYRV